jgi:HlyD family secretion protein
LRAIPYKWILIFFAACLVVFLLYRWWSGPIVAGYAVHSMPLQQNVVATGRVANVSRTEVGSEISGVVETRLVEEGDQVKPGDLLLVLKADDLEAQVRQAKIALKELANIRRPQANTELATAKAQYEQAKREADRRRQAESSVLSKEEIEQAIEASRVAQNNYEAARIKAASVASGQVEEASLQTQLASAEAQLAKTQIRATVSGTILTRNVEPGSLVQTGQTLFTIAKDGPTEIRVALDERNLASLALEQKASVIADAYSERPFSAFVNYIAPSIDPQRGTVELKLNVNPIPDFLRQDMTVSVNIVTAKRDQALVVPNSALLRVKGDQATILLVQHHKIVEQAVRLGLRNLEYAEVLKGLSDGDQIINHPDPKLKVGMRVRLNLETTAKQDLSSAKTANELPVQLD